MLQMLTFILTIITMTGCEILQPEMVDFSIRVKKQFTGEEGLCITINCFFTVPQRVSQPIRRSWIKGDPQKPSLQVPYKSNNDPHNENKHDCTLVLTHLDKEQTNGEYRLKLEWGLDDTYIFPKPVNIKVKELTKKPTVDVPQLTAGEKAEITCSVPGDCEDPLADVAWTGIEPEMIHLIGEGVPGYATHFSVMTFHPESKHHKANLTCTVTFQGKIQTETTVVLEVRHAPTILNESHCYTWADELTCVCVSSGVPSPQINWPRLDGEYYSASSAENTISIITVSVASFTKLNTSIECVSENPLGSSKMKIQVQSRAGKHNVSWTRSAPWMLLMLSCVVNVILTSCLAFVLRRRENHKAKDDNHLYMNSVKKEDPVYESIQTSE